MSNIEWQRTQGGEGGKEGEGESPLGRVCSELCETSSAVRDVSSPISGGSSFNLFSLRIRVVKLYILPQTGNMHNNAFLMCLILG